MLLLQSGHPEGKKLATYERLEAMSLLELAVWKVKMDGCSGAGDTGNELEKALRFSDLAIHK
jgi:hypothetical protein